MQVEDSYSVVVTPHHKECRDFYVRWFKCAVVFEASWFTLLALPGQPPRNVAFMDPDHPSSPPGPEVFTGAGVFMTLQVPTRQQSSLGFGMPAPRLSMTCGTSHGASGGLLSGILRAHGLTLFSRSNRRAVFGTHTLLEECDVRPPRKSTPPYSRTTG